MYEGRSLGFSLPHVHQSRVIHWYFRHGKRRGSRNSLLRGIYRACLVGAVCFGWSCIYMLTIKLNVYVLCWVLRTVNRVGMLYMTCDIYDMLFHQGGLTNICISKLAKHWVKVWLVSANTLSENCKMFKSVKWRVFHIGPNVLMGVRVSKSLAVNTVMSFFFSDLDSIIFVSDFIW